MKVAIATHFPMNPESPRGGVEAVSVNLVRALANFKDLQIDVITLDSSITELKKAAWHGVTLHRLPSINGRVLTNATGPCRKQISDYMRKLNPDVIHAHDTYGLMVKGLEIPRVFTIHGFIYADTLLSKTKWAWLRSKLWYRIETAGWADQPHIISISPYVRERLTGIAKGVIHDIDNPISESFFDIRRNEKKGVIFSAAVISQRKNTLTLVKAFAKVLEAGIDAELRLAGPVVEESYGYLLKDTISSMGLKSKITLLGQIRSEQIHQELSIASAFALVSLEEGSPMGIEEAMAAGVPIITSNRCGMPYMLRHGESGFLVNPDDENDIARHIKRMLQNDELRSRMSDECRLIAADRFHPAKVARRTKAVYESIIDR